MMSGSESMETGFGEGFLFVDRTFSLPPILYVNLHTSGDESAIATDATSNKGLPYPQIHLFVGTTTVDDDLQ